MTTSQIRHARDLLVQSSGHLERAHRRARAYEEQRQVAPPRSVPSGPDGPAGRGVGEVRRPIGLIPAIMTEDA
jgi:hypothetical protein